MTQQQWGRQGQQGFGGGQWGPPTGQRPVAPQPSSRVQAGPWGPPSQVPGAGGPWGGQWQQPSSPLPTPRPPQRGNPVLKVVVAAIVGIIAVALIANVVTDLVGGQRAQGQTTQYQQEDYQVPPPEANPPELPLPKVEADLDRLTKRNKVYDSTVPSPTRCEMTEIKLGTATKTQIKKSMDELTACLSRVWDPTLQQAGLTFVRPVSNVYSTSIQSPCGKIPAGNAVYCAANQQIYLSTTLNQVLPPEVAGGRFVVETVIAHEVGHAVQYRTGIGAAASYEIQNLPKAESLEVNRRLEVQADCFAGLFLESVARSRGMSQTDLANIRTLMVAIGDDTLSGKPAVVGNHGHGSSRQYWAEMGLASTKVGACNTFVAPATLVK
ncbi:neutral zinc metallopeptidase [Aestuariimicrobium sp. T2.26MG-19.2B]|uniref:neutral zinc metallopeptidase n=1 Tax=Aestuariimicrobium sp. T2.26MG-19.2B TaxID=3040679 RepID=UPI0025402DD6|nr:neutral zinc metallopeptidase [Aestuariimicrobium sp. T2.26MG-19.2B]